MILPLSAIEEISSIARDRYITIDKNRAFPFEYAIAVPEPGSIERVYQKVLVDYRHDVGVFIDTSKEQSND